MAFEKTRKKLETSSAVKETIKEIENLKKQGIKLDIDKVMSIVKNRVKPSSEAEWKKEEPKIRLRIERAILGETAEGKALDKFAKQQSKSALEKAFKGTAAAPIITKAKGLGAKIKEMLGWSDDKSDEEKSTWRKAIAGLLSLIGIKKIGDKESSFLSFLGLDFLFGKNNKEKFEKFKKDIKLPKGFTLVGEYKEKKEELELTIKDKTNTDAGKIKFNQKTGQITLLLSTGSHSSNKIEDINKHLTAENLKPVAKTESKEKLSEKHKKYVELFQKKKLTLDAKSIENDLKILKNHDVSDVEKLINEVPEKDSNLHLITKALEKALKVDKYKIRLAFLLFQKAKPEDVNKIIAVIENKDNKYTLEKTAEKINEFLAKAAGDTSTTAIDKLVKDKEKTTTS